MAITEKKLEQLHERMQELQIFEKDLEEKFILASGKGGQKVQKSYSCVFLKHLPTNLSVKAQKSRQREENRFFARRELCDLYEKNVLKRKTIQDLKNEKIRKQKKRKERKNKNILK
ncbi:MAG TPA: peptide chain release factor-like protein [Chlamydiales bacterium]|nr:peptide chain release factor-like protein [Chlamydiales bacterium]